MPAPTAAPTDIHPLMRDREAAQALGVSRRHLWTLTASGELPAVRISPRVTRWDPRDLSRFIDARRR